MSREFVVKSTKVHISTVVIDHQFAWWSNMIHDGLLRKWSRQSHPERTTSHQSFSRVCFLQRKVEWTKVMVVCCLCPTQLSSTSTLCGLTSLPTWDFNYLNKLRVMQNVLKLDFWKGVTLLQINRHVSSEMMLLRSFSTLPPHKVIKTGIFKPKLNLIVKSKHELNPHKTSKQTNN